jgi:hypothetical protein
MALDLQSSFDGINEEGKFAPPRRVGFGGAFHLAFRDLNANFGENGASLGEVYVEGHTDA